MTTPSRQQIEDALPVLRAGLAAVHDAATIYAETNDSGPLRRVLRSGPVGAWSCNVLLGAAYKLGVSGDPLAEALTTLGVGEQRTR
jgi:hypothetical protein